MYDIEIVLLFWRMLLALYIYGPVAKWQHWGMFIHYGNKLHVPPNAVRVEMPPALISESFRYLRVSSCMTGTRRCPVSNARSAQKFGGKKKKQKKKKKKNMKK